MLSVIILLVSCCNSSAQKNIRSNLEIFDDEISRQLEQILFKPDLRRDIQFVFSVNSYRNREEETKFLNSVIKKSAERFKIWASLTKDKIVSGDSLSNIVYIEIAEMKTRYPGFAQNTFLGTKLVRRNLISIIRVDIKGNNYSFSSADSININYSDRIELDNIDNLETSDYEFTQAKPPEISLYEEIVFPVAVIVISAAAAILFFAIRSK